MGATGCGGTHPALSMRELISGKAAGERFMVRPLAGF